MTENTPENRIGWHRCPECNEVSLVGPVNCHCEARDRIVAEQDGIQLQIRSEPCAYKRACLRAGWELAMAYKASGQDTDT